MPSLWPAQSHGTVYLQQFANHTACIRLSASSKLIRSLYVLMTDSLFLRIEETFVMDFWPGAE